MPNYVESLTIGPLSYHIEKRGNNDYRLWLNGCRIGRPRPDKPANEIWEYSAGTVAAARKEIKKDATERLNARIREAGKELAKLRGLLAGLRK